MKKPFWERLTAKKGASVRSRRGKTEAIVAAWEKYADVGRSSNQNVLKRRQIRLQVGRGGRVSTAGGGVGMEVVSYKKEQRSDFAFVKAQ